MNRIYRFDTAKTILIVQVVFCHAITFCDGPLSLKEFARFSILGCAMPVFMFISGWFSKSELSIRSVLGLSTLFVICNTVGNLIWAISHGTTFNPLLRAVVMWYLMVLIIYRLAMPILSRFSSKTLVISSFFLSWCVVLLPVGLPTIANRLIAFLPFFVLGYVVSREPRMKGVRAWISAEPGKVVYACILVAILIAGAVFSIEGIRPGFLTRNITFSISGGGMRIVLERFFFQALYIVMGICFLKACPIKKTCLAEFGARTLPVYLFHPYLLVPIAALVSNYQALSCWQIRYCMMGGAAIGSLLFFHRFFSILTQKIVRLRIRG